MTEKLLFGFIFLAFNSPLFGYYFGKNKIQTRDYDFKVVESDHFRVYFYSGGERLYHFAVPVLEQAYEEYSKIFGIRIKEKIPVILYNSPKHFQETNVIPDLIEEGVGGFTEIFKNRVVVPFTGSYKEFRHVLRHELVHVFQYKIILSKLKGSLLTSSFSRIPLWVMEGMAEYLSQGWSRDAEAYVRDLVINNRLPSIEELGYYGGYIVYKEGQLIYRYIAEKYGEKKVGEFFELMVYKKSLEDAVKKSLGVKLKDLEQQFELYVKTTFYPLVRDYDLPDGLRKMTSHEEDNSYMNVAPALSEDGSKLVFITDKGERASIVLYSVASGKKLKTLIKGARTPDFENLHLFRPGVSFSRDGREIVFSAQSGEGDKIYILELKSGKVEKTIKVDVDAIYTPVFSPDGKYIAFVGIKNSQSDIYLYDLHTGKVSFLTRDPYDDRDPCFSPDGKGLFFVSDRYEMEEDSVYIFGAYAVFYLDLGSSSIKRITPYTEELYSPKVVSDSLLYFIRNYHGSLNIFMYNMKTQKLYKITNFISEVKYFDVAPKENRIAFSLLWNGGYDIYIQTYPDNVKYEEVEWEETKPLFVKSFVSKSSKRYSAKFSLDWVNGYAEYSYPYGFAGFLALGLSDELGNHQITILTDLYQDILNSQFEIVYAYLPKRTDYYASLYQYWDLYYISDYEAYLDKNRGIAVFISYPLSRFRRFEFGLNFENQVRHYLVTDIFGNMYEIPGYREEKNFFGIYFAHVFDNVLYSYYSDPLDGTRYFAGLIKSVFLDKDIFVGVVDFRHYLRLSKRYIWANRFLAKYSSGRDSVIFTLGGPYDLRGYSYGEFLGSRVILFNTELRVPFIDQVKIAFPIPLEFGGIRGVLFMDAGAAWSAGEKLEPFESFPKLKDLKADVGAGIRIELGFAKLKIDWAKKTDFVNFYDHIWQVSLGTDF